MPRRSWRRPARAQDPLSAEGIEALGALAVGWDALAATRGTPFVSAAWLTAWWGAYGRGRPQVVVVRDEEGRLAGAAACRRAGGDLRAMADFQSGNWDVLARDVQARRSVWRRLAAAGGPRLEPSAGRFVGFGTGGCGPRGCCAGWPRPSKPGE